MYKHSIHPLSHETQQVLLSWLVRLGDIPQSDQKFCSVLPVVDNKMNPQFRFGGLYVCRIVQPDSYLDLIGKVVDLWPHDVENEMLGRHTLGRLKAIDNDVICLTFDNPDFPEVQISQNEVAFLSEVFLLINSPVA